MQQTSRHHIEEHFENPLKISLENDTCAAARQRASASAYPIAFANSLTSTNGSPYRWGSFSI